MTFDLTHTHNYTFIQQTFSEHHYMCDPKSVT